MSSPSRIQRVADQIHTELSEIIQRRMKDPPRGLLTITAVEVSRDLRQAKVYVSSLTEEDLEANLILLERAKGFLRSELATMPVTGLVGKVLGLFDA